METRVYFVFCWLIWILGISPLLSINAQNIQAIKAGAIGIDRSGFEMVYVPTGTVEMGITRENFVELLEKGVFPYATERDIELITLSYEHLGVYDPQTVALSAFWIDRYEVTIEQYQSRTEYCRGTGECASTDWSDHPELAANPQQPQVGINWFDAMLFCNAREARLPTESEWEYAASGPDNFIFPWRNTLVAENITSSQPTIGTTYPVGSRPNNVSWIGAYDMASNAAEWVDGRLVSYDPTSENLLRKSNQATFDVYRVLRGGSFYTTLLFATTFARTSAHPQSRGDGGIRCARSSDPRE
jgi:formylglycine-generating enzyme required for sulfatase activity